MSYILGLTGSIGMGKSTTSAMFRDHGVPVWDADQAVHDLYAQNRNAQLAIAELCPDAWDGQTLDRSVMRQAVVEDKTLLPKIEAIVHPMIAQDRAEFLDRNADQPLIILDVPILYEMGLASLCDGVLLVTADAQTQRNRVLSRPGMTEEALNTILAKQIPDAEKRQRADFILETTSIEAAERFVAELIERLSKGTKDA